MELVDLHGSIYLISGSYSETKLQDALLIPHLSMLVFGGPFRCNRQLQCIAHGVEDILNSILQHMYKVTFTLTAQTNSHIHFSCSWGNAAANLYLIYHTTCILQLVMTGQGNTGCTPCTLPVVVGYKLKFNVLATLASHTCLTPPHPCCCVVQYMNMPVHICIHIHAPPSGLKEFSVLNLVWKYFWCICLNIDSHASAPISRSLW
mmetsp:Transcript_88184/g.153198  ORF Transcript_88184/g.153198 Transcript_88184/m.153198 type:complete len:205 (-) Transcript_88184:1098-1712(-)